MSLRTQPLVKQSSLYSRLRNFNNDIGGKSASDQPKLDMNSAKRLADRYVLGSVANSKLNDNTRVRENVLTKMLVWDHKIGKCKDDFDELHEEQEFYISAAAQNLVNRINRASSNRFEKNLNTSKLRDF